MLPSRLATLIGGFLCATALSVLTSGMLLAAGLRTPSLAVRAAMPVLPISSEHQIDPGQRPPAEAQQAQPPQADMTPLPPEKPKCVTDTSEFRDGGYTIELVNACELTIRCTVQAYLVTSRGPTKAAATLTLAPQSQGPAAKKTHAVKLSSSGGMARTL